jgi:histidinol-phosphatase
MAILDLDLDLALDAVRRAADAAGGAALAHFRTGVAVERKPDRSPVTAADRDAEAAILEIVRAALPQATILAEESGRHAGDPSLRWIIDPLDGTRGFARGGSFWGPLVALEHDGEIVAGAAGLPALGDLYFAARGRGCFDRDGGPVRLSRIDEWSEATLSVGELPRLLVTTQAAGVRRLIDSAASTRCYGDVGGALMVLGGRAEAWLEAGVQLWDLAPLPILFEEAGGAFTNLAGRRSLGEGSAVAGNRALHRHVLETLAGAASGG